MYAQNMTADESLIRGFVRFGGWCPMCREGVTSNEFDDIRSAREFGISGLCQKCQNSVFNPQCKHGLGPRDPTCFECEYEDES